MADPKRWNVVYPIYINEEKTVKQGRKIGKDKAVEKPRLDEIVEVCKYLKLPFLEERNKSYSRDFFQIGRVRVNLKRADGAPIRDDIKNRHQFLLEIADKIPKLKSRIDRVNAPEEAPTAAKGKKGKKGKRKKK